MKFVVLVFSGWLGMVATSGVSAADERYPAAVSQWVAIEPPPKDRRSDYQVWHYAANYSRLEWKVRRTDDAVLAAVASERERRAEAASRLPFVPRAGMFRGASASLRVDDGYLVSFNEGEFGSELHWFDEQGKRSYRVSDHQVVDFFTVDGRIHAIEGLAHLGLSRGSVVALSRVNGRWQAQPLQTLPAAPSAVAVGNDGSAFIVLSDGLSVMRNGQVELLLTDLPWWSFYPNSVVAGNDGALYVGMRQYVARVDLADRSVRYLIPDRRALNVLPADQEAGIRQMAERLPH